MTKTRGSLEIAIAEVRGLNRNGLIDRFRKLYGREPPPRLSTWNLALAIAHRLQVDATGGLRPTTRKSLLANTGNYHRPASPGTLLIREWHGLQHTVIVHPSHVEYAGSKFRSLTEVAFRITGQKRSGPAFFGLRSNTNG